MIRSLKSKDRLSFLDFCNKKVDNKTFNNCLKRNDRCLIKEENGIFQGILIVNGYADKNPRKSMKILSNDLKTADDLVKCLTWTFPEDIFIKIKKHNPIAEVLLGTRGYNSFFRKNSNNSFQGYGFRQITRESGENVFCRKYNAKYDYSKKRIFIKEDDQIEG